MRETFDVAVVGGGVFGLATAVELARRGRGVAVIDRFGCGHPATSSTGRSRGIRIAYDHPFYVLLARDAIRRWRDLESRTGRTILHLKGQIDFGAAAKLAGIVAAVREAGGEVEEMTSAALRRLLPHLQLGAEESGLFHPEAGTVLSDEAMAALKAQAVAAGVTLFEQERVLAIDPGASARLTTSARTLSAGTVVVAAGPWSGALLADLGIQVPLAPAIAQVTFIAAQELVDLPGIGEWGGDRDGVGGVYGHPVPGIGYKLAFSSGQQGWSPEVKEWRSDAEEERRLFAWVERRMPAFPRKVQATQRHPWTMTPDGDFVVDRVGPIVLACGCSGHAFKFGPALGPLVADVVDGHPANPLFRLDRPSLQTGLVSASDPISR